jgi:hypothetical protein
MSSTQPGNPATAHETASADQSRIPSVVQTPTTSSAANKVVTPRSVRTPTKKVVTPVKETAVPMVQTAVKTPAKAAAKVARKPPVKATLPAATAVKAAVQVDAQAVKIPAVKPKVEKLLKDKKPKLVRDSFTIPKLEYLILDQLKQRSGELGCAVKKSELIRAGIKALAEMPDASFLTAVKAVPTIKTGRPAKD